MRNVQTAVS